MITKQEILDYLYQRRVLVQAQRLDSTDTTREDAELARLTRKIADVKAAPEIPRRA